MATNQNIIAITIRAALPTGKTLDEQFAALSIVKQAHETGDYSALLKAAQDVQIKTEAKTRRVEEQPAAAAPEAIPALPPEEEPRAFPDTSDELSDPDFPSDVIPPMPPEDFALAAEPAPKKSR
jgi:hypothetical protein